MWIIQEPDGTLHDRGNLPSHNLLPALLEQFPGARILRSLRPCHNEFGALAFAKHWVQRGEREVAQQDGTTATEPIMVCERVGNTYAMEGDRLVVYSPNGEKLGAFEMEVARDPRA